MRVAFTGHRPNKLGGYDHINPIFAERTIACLTKLQAEEPITVAYNGLALGYDQLALTICLNMGIPVIGCIPILGQDSRWPIKSRTHYQKLLTQVETVKIYEEIYSDTEYWRAKRARGTSFYHLMQIRNEYMVDNADVVIGCWDGTTGGTYNCLMYAKNLGKRRINVYPKKSST